MTLRAGGTESDVAAGPHVATPRRRAQSSSNAVCPVTQYSAFLSSSGGKTIKNYEFVAGQSCAQFTAMKLVVQDLFIHASDYTTMTVNYVYYGKVVQGNVVTCAAFIASGGDPEIAFEDSKLYSDFLSSTLDKPYPSNFSSTLAQVCPVALARSGSCPSSQPWILTSSSLVEATYARPAQCCDGDGACVTTELPTYGTGVTSTDPNAPPPSSPSSPSSSSSSSSSSSKTGLIVGVVVGAGAGLTLIAGGVWWFCFRRRLESSGLPCKAGSVAGGSSGSSDGTTAKIQLRNTPSFPASSRNMGPPSALMSHGPPSSAVRLASPGGATDGAGTGAAKAVPPIPSPIKLGPMAAAAAAAAVGFKSGSSASSAFTTGSSLLQAMPEGDAVDVAAQQQADDARRAAAMSTLAVADHLRIAYADVEFENGKEIGQGGFSVVYCCSWQGHRVVLKVVRPELASERQRAILVREALLMRELQHPAVARVYGVIDEAPHHALVMQYYKRGTLEDYMTGPDTKEDYESLTVLDRLRLAGQVADGMAYLHTRSPPIVHGDLKPSNLLVDEDNKVVITDFGLAVQLMSGSHPSTTPSPRSPYPSTLKAVIGSTPLPNHVASSSSASVFSTLWTSPTSALSIFISPPEVLAAPQAPRQTTADVFAFGVTLWQIMAGRTPYRGMSADMVIFAVCQGKRPAMPDTDEVPEGVASIIEDCWAQVAEKRPTFAQVAARLKAQIQMLKE